MSDGSGSSRLDRSRTSGRTPDRTSGRTPERHAPAGAPTARWPRGWPIGLYAAFAVAAVALYQPALRGPYLFDDIIYLVSHPYTESASLANLAAILDPFGDARFYSANYEPVHLIAAALERHIFADALIGYHLVNVLIHAGNAVLLVAWVRAAAVPAAAALAGGVFFLVHPANVEAVAWMSQLKTTGSTALALGALLLLRRRPAVAALLFGLALLTKAAGMFALPTAAALLWSDPGARRRDWLWLSAWLAIAALYAVPQFTAFAHLGEVEVAAFRDPWVHARTIAAVGARYLAMAPFAIGVSAWQEPPPALSWLDPWWLAALPAGALLGWRAIACLRRRSVEAAFWVSAAASFAPVSQLFPFATPVADRYLYAILPGLVGGVLVAGSGLPCLRGRGALRAAAIALPAALLLWFAWQTRERAALWQHETRLMLDAARAYPDGATAHVLRARSAAQTGDVDLAVALLREAVRRGIDSFTALERDPGLAPLLGTPQFGSLVRDMAGDWIALAQRRGYSTQSELRFLAIAHSRRGEYAEAVSALERALAAGGPLGAVVEQELAEARALRDADLRSRGAGGGGAAPR
jgi:hypothetical protein